MDIETIIKTMKYLLTLLLSVAISGCSKRFESKKIIDNRSSHSLKVILYGGKEVFGSWTPNDNFIINSNNQAVIVDFNSSSGLSYDEGNCARSDIDSIVVEVIDNNFKVSKDLTNDDSWVFTKRAHSSGIDTECKATITDADIVLK